MCLPTVVKCDRDYLNRKWGCLCKRALWTSGAKVADLLLDMLHHRRLAYVAWDTDVSSTGTRYICCHTRFAPVSVKITAKYRRDTLWKPSVHTDHLCFKILCQYSFEVISNQGAWRFISTALLSFLLLLKCLGIVANCHISLRSKWCTQILFIKLSFCTDVLEDFSALRQLHVPVVRKLSTLCGSRRVVLNAKALTGLVGSLQHLQKKVWRGIYVGDVFCPTIV